MGRHGLCCPQGQNPAWALLPGRPAAAPARSRALLPQALRRRMASADEAEEFGKAKDPGVKGWLLAHPCLGAAGDAGGGGRLPLLFLTPGRPADAVAPPEHGHPSWVKGVASPPATSPPPKTHGEEVTPCSGTVAPQPPGSVAPGRAGGRAAPWLVCLLRASLARRPLP